MINNTFSANKAEELYNLSLYYSSSFSIIMINDTFDKNKAEELY